MNAMRRIRSSIWVGLAATVLAATACADPVTPILDVRGEADDSRPDLGSDNCVSADDLSVGAEQIIYIMHALPEQLGGSPGELEITVATGCGEITKTVTHDADGLALVPVSLPEGAECGAVVTTTIANASDRCVLTGAGEQGASCSVACTSTDSDDTSTDGGDDSTDSTG